MTAADDQASFRVIRADSFVDRLMGLMFRKSIGPNDTLLLTRCNAVHTFFMRFDIDLIFLDRTGRVLKLCERVRPCRFLIFCPGAADVLECAAGFIARHRVSLRHALEFPPGTAQAPGPVVARFSP